MLIFSFQLPGLPNPLLVGEVFREYSLPWETLARQYIEDVWNATKNFVEQALQYLTDATVSDALLRHLLDPVMDERLELAYTKLEELMAVHKEHPETRNQHFTDNYNALQKEQYDYRSTKSLKKALHKSGGHMDEDEITDFLSKLGDNGGADMDVVAAESTFNAMEAFYQVCYDISPYMIISFFDYHFH